MTFILCLPEWRGYECGSCHEFLAERNLIGMLRNQERRQCPHCLLDFDGIVFLNGVSVEMVQQGFSATC